MVTIRLHNSLTRKKEEFQPLDPKNVRMYVCGPTVYDRAHLGNARPVVVFDTLYRLLRHVYGEGHVTYVRNFTDVDDKINAEAQRRKAAGRSESLEDLIHERTEETIGWYHADMDAIGALRPDHEPRATEYIAEMIAMIEGLIAKDHAYAAEGHVLFRVRSYPGYGALSGRTVDDMIAGARVEVAPYKEDPMDFVLWKPSDADLPGWDSPWGRGRPGWHIECSAMADRLLWERMKDRLSPQALAAPHVFDIHGGGLDLQFPHHENELAQSCCAHHGEGAEAAGFARFWLHNEMLQVEGKKMSKSLGNFFTVRDLLDAPEISQRNEAIPKMTGDEIRLAFLMTHYRKPMDLTLSRVGEVKATLEKWQRLAMDGDVGYDPDFRIIEALADDLNTPLVLQILHEMSADLSSPEKRNIFRSSLHFLGIGLKWRSHTQAIIQGLLREDDEFRRIEELINKARSEKNYARADALRDEVRESGAEISITKDGAKISYGALVDYDMLRQVK